MVRVLQFSDFINRDDFIDTIVQNANTEEFEVGVCVRMERSNIAPPAYSDRTPRWVLNSRHRLGIPLAARRLAGILQKWQADIVHAHHYECSLIAWLATRMHGGARLVVGRHYSDAIYRLRSAAKQKALLAAEQSVNQAAARIVAPSSQIYDILTRRQGVDPDKVDVVPYGFAPEKYALPAPEEARRIREELGLGDCFTLGTFGRLHEEKGQRFLLDAVRRVRQRCPTVRLLVVGEGPERRRLERQIRTEGLQDTVQLLGWRRDAMRIMAGVDAVVHSSLQEAFSQVMVEALWMSKPLVITDVSGATDIIEDERNGLLVPKADAAALATAIERLWGDRDFCQRLGATGREYVSTHLTLEQSIPRYETVYRRAIQTPARPSRRTV